MLERTDRIDCKTLDKNDLDQVVASSGFTENKFGWAPQPPGFIKPSLGHSY